MMAAELLGQGKVILHQATKGNMYLNPSNSRGDMMQINCYRGGIDKDLEELGESRVDDGQTGRRE
jgi:hypothetical protein